MLNITTAKNKLKQWAEKTPEVLCLIIYGSYVTGNPDGDSDLDIALIVEPEVGDQTPAANYYYHENEWITELQEILNFSIVHLRWYGGNETPKVKEGVEKGCVIVYDEIDISNKQT